MRENRQAPEGQNGNVQGVRFHRIAPSLESSKRGRGAAPPPCYTQKGRQDADFGVPDSLRLSLSAGVQLHGIVDLVGIVGQLRLRRAFHTFLRDHRFHNGRVGGDLVHDLGQQALHAPPAGHGRRCSAQWPCRRRPPGRPPVEFQLHVVIFQQLLVLLHQRVLAARCRIRTRSSRCQGVQRCDHRQTAHQLRDDAEFQKIVGLHLSQTAG